MNPIDHTDTKVLLIGTSSFVEGAAIDAIPNVLANLKYFRESLINPEIVGIPEENITLSLNENKIQIEKKLKGIAANTKNKKYTLIVYYTGHGILSSEDYQLYLTTHETTRRDLEIEGICISDFRQYIKKSVAGRKIVILDCCHSGAIIGSMGDMPSKIQAELNGFEGTYIMTSAAEDTPSLFPIEAPEIPTYFTGEFLKTINEGLDTGTEYCSLHDIYEQVETTLSQMGLPHPQQSNFNNADQIFFSLNKKFNKKETKEEVAWKSALQENRLLTYLDFKNKYPQSMFAMAAIKKIRQIEDDNCWNKAVNNNTVPALIDYTDKYPDGKYVAQAIKLITLLRKKDKAVKRILNVLGLVVLIAFIIVFIISKSGTPKSLQAVQNTKTSSDSISKSTVDSNQVPNINKFKADTANQYVIYSRLINNATKLAQNKDYKTAIDSIQEAYNIGSIYSFNGNQKLQNTISNYKTLLDGTNQSKKANYEIVDQTTPGIIIVKLKNLYGAVNNNYKVIAPCKYTSPPFPPTNKTIEFQNSDGQIDTYKF